MSARPWTVQADPALAAVATDVATDVAGRVTDPVRREEAVALAPRQTRFPTAVRWTPHAVAQGDAGLALMCAQLDRCFPNDGWDIRGHELLALATADLEGVPSPRVGLFDGLSGLAFATLALSRRGTRYARLLAAIENALVPRALALADVVATRRGIAVSSYDAISGLAGVVAYLLLRADEPRMAGPLQASVRALVALADPSADPPRWHSPPRLLDDRMRASFPSGNLNCGLAHGIPGPLAVLALACRQDVPVAGLSAAVRRIAAWLADHAVKGPCGPTWPLAVPLDGGPVAGTRTAWCYGSPGVARALWLAGDAVDGREHCELAVAAMEAVYRTPVVERQVESPTFCHGVAGLLQVTLRFAHDTRLPVFTHAAVELVAQLAGQYEPGALLGYRSVERGDSVVDQPGLLDGAPGVALVLLAASTPHAPAWDRLFLLS